MMNKNYSKSIELTDPINCKRLAKKHTWKWSIHGPKHHNVNQSQSLKNGPVQYLSGEWLWRGQQAARVDMMTSSNGNIFA